MIDTPSAKPPHAGWKTTVELDRITWGDLRTLVALAAFKDADDEVEFEWASDASDIPYPTGIILRGEG